MADKGRKPGKGVDSDKLSEALRRAEEAVLKDGKLRKEEAKKEKEVKPRKPVELDAEHFKEEKSSKPIDLDAVLFDESRKRKQKPVEPPKPASGPPMADSGKQEKPGVSQPSSKFEGEPKKPEPKKPEALPPKPAKRPPPNLSFGELDLRGASTGAPELELAATQKEPSAKPAERKPPARRKPAEEFVPYVPRRSYARRIKIFLIVLLVLAAIGGGVYGFLKWRESVEAAEAAEKAKIESSSRDSLMDDKFKKEKFK